MKTSHLDRQRKTETPFGWTPVYVTNSKGKQVQLWRCPHVHLNLFTNQTERCSYTCRKDRTNGQHYHEYNIKNEDQSILGKTYKKIMKNTNKSFNESLEASAANFIGSTSISTATACSDQFHRFLCQVAELSIKYYRANPNILINPKSVIRKLNKNSIKDSLLKSGDIAFREMMNKLKQFKFVNLMIDAATVNGMRIVHTTLSNPFSGLAPLPFRSTKKERNDWGILEYKEEIETALAEISSLNEKNNENNKIHIVSICHDRLPAQSIAISKVLDGINKVSTIAPIVNVSCLNHLINNSFIQTINNCTELNEFIPQLEEVISILRKREAVNFIGKRINNPPKTRWLYLCDSLSFIVNNVTEINIYLVEIWKQSHPIEEDQSPDDYEMQALNEAKLSDRFLELYLILVPLQKASLSFECEQSRLSDVIPIIQTLIESYKKICNLPNIDETWSLVILHELLCQFFARVDTFIPDEVWASYAVSRAGRYYLRYTNAPSGLIAGEINDYSKEEYCFNDAAKNMENELNFIIDGCITESEACSSQEEEDFDEPIINASNKEINSVDSENQLTSPDENSITPAMKEAVEGENNLNQKFRNSLIEFRAKSLEELLQSDLAHNTYDKALDVIKKYYKKIDKDANDEIITKYFDDWLFNNNNFFPAFDMNQDNDFSIWQNFYKHDKLHVISIIALRLISIGTSESDVERLFSIHRYIVHDRMTNLSAKVLLARLRMRAKAISDNCAIEKND